MTLISLSVRFITADKVQLSLFAIAMLILMEFHIICYACYLFCIQQFFRGTGFSTNIVRRKTVAHLGV